MKDPIENVTEFILRNSSQLNISQRIRLYEDAATLIPDAQQRSRIEHLISNLQTADRACREFSFVEDQI